MLYYLSNVSRILMCSAFFGRCLTHLEYCMNPVIGHCPICHENLEVTRLHCRHCDTALEGHFSLGRLFQLSPEQLQFVEVFLRNEGKINRVGQDLGLSYPAVRARLTDIIFALGYELEDTEPTTVSEGERQEILQRISAGEISPEEAIQILRGEA